MSKIDLATATIASAQQSGDASAGGASGGSDGDASGGGGGDGGGGSAMMIPPALIPFLERVNRATIAHGTIMCLAFVIFFPSGSLLIRLGHFKGVVYLHAGIQMFAYMMALAGLGLGVYVANAPTKLGYPSQVFIILQRMLSPGSLQEANSKSYRSANTTPSLVSPSSPPSFSSLSSALSTMPSTSETEGDRFGRLRTCGGAALS